MSDEPPVIITATPNISWLEPETSTIRQPSRTLVEEAKLCERAGASHPPLPRRGVLDRGDRSPARRDRPDHPVRDVEPADPRAHGGLREEGADMISIIVSHHDEAFVGLDVHVLHTREELAEYAELSREHGVKLELETWHTGSIWNIELDDRAGAARRSLLHLDLLRLAGRLLEPGRRSRSTSTAAATCRTAASRPFSAMGPDQFRLLVHAMALGDHVRVGTEDYPFDFVGKPATTTELVEQMPSSAASVGRPVATRDRGQRDHRRAGRTRGVNLRWRAVHEPGDRQGRGRVGRGPGHRAGDRQQFAREGYATVGFDVAEPERPRRRTAGSFAAATSPTRGRSASCSPRAATRARARSTCLRTSPGSYWSSRSSTPSCAEFRRIVDVNLGGTFLTCKYAIPIMERQGGGVIVNLASVSGHVGQVDHSLYGATKGAVIRRSAARWPGNWHRRTSGSLSVSPGSVDTAMLRSDIESRPRRPARPSTR